MPNPVTMITGVLTGTHPIPSTPVPVAATRLQFFLTFLTFSTTADTGTLSLEWSPDSKTWTPWGGATLTGDSGGNPKGFEIALPGGGGYLRGTVSIVGTFNVTATWLFL